MSDLLVVGLAGFLASLVDGALGMGFGPTSSTILLSAGISPATASTTVNLAKVATGLVAGVSHWRFGNIDRPLVLQLAIPGAVGALLGTTVLVFVDGDDLRPLLAVVLLAGRHPHPAPLQPAAAARGPTPTPGVPEASCRRSTRTAWRWRPPRAASPTVWWGRGGRSSPRSCSTAACRRASRSGR